MNTLKIIYLSTLALAISITGCKKDTPNPDTSTDAVAAATAPPPTSIVPIVTTPADSNSNTVSGGVFITNEGPFGSGSGTVGYYNRSTKSYHNEIFQNTNSYPLGNIVQSINIFNNAGYIVVNNADKVEVIDATTLVSGGVISGLSAPRYFLGINNTTGYVSQWGAGVGSIQVIDLSTNTITSTIATGIGAEKMLMIGDKVYVVCTEGVVTVINTTTNTVEKTITVAAGAKAIKVDSNGDLWVLCSGKWDSSWSALEVTGCLVRIDGATDAVNLTLSFASTSKQPSNLVINNAKNTLYYTYNGNVVSHDITSTTLNATATISRGFYGLGIDPTNDYFYASDAGDFSSNGKVLRYTAAGVVVDSFTVGVIPGAFFFN